MSGMARFLSLAFAKNPITDVSTISQVKFVGVNTD